MFRQASSKNQRNKGFKVKYVVQMLVLLGVCIWLLYQVKHSRDKRKEFEESTLSVPNLINSRVDKPNLGRKDLNEGSVMSFQNEKREIEENNEEESKIEEKKGVDDEIVEQEQEKRGEEEFENGEAFTDEHKKNEEKEQIEEDTNSLKNQDNDEGDDDGKIQEAREEHYRGDDASSAVVRDNLSILPDSDDGNLTNSDVQHNENSDSENKDEHVQETEKHDTDNNVGNDQQHDENEHLNNKFEHDQETENHDSNNKKFTDPTESENIEQGESYKNMTEVEKETIQSILTNNTKVIDDESKRNGFNENTTNAFESEVKDSLAELVNEFPSNSSQLSVTTLKNNSITETVEMPGEYNVTIAEPSQEQNTTAEIQTSESFPNTTFGLISQREENEDGEASEENVDSHIIDENGDGAHENLNSATGSLVQEEKDVVTDLDTLPIVGLEGTKHEEISSE